jgi:competence protein ComEA
VVRGLFTRDERAVVLFLAGALLAGSLVSVVRRVEAPVPTPGPRDDVERVLVDLNGADAELLETLPGIGPVRAREIVRLREGRGRFSAVDELVDVRGIGPATLERVRPHVVIADTGRTWAGGDGR